ncbi:hypothetical protein JX265_009773 [Neoarthrinium moseri]|uniref:Uncharacterized protein n=1 Tax=Neoarthrinium moseri TaxID=1658444 RepID=A0A9Q0AMD9_9PEZI|nr:hypothetical protein JX265_009773 [Neoarthrinium moseri]
MSDHQTIQDFMLTRASCPTHSTVYAFMEPFVGDDCTWTSQRVKRQDNHVVLTYGTAVAHQAYVVVDANITEEDPPYRRYTEMRLNQMIIDTYRAAGGNLDTLQYVGLYCILNESVRYAIVKEFLSQGQDFQQAAQVEVTPASATWNDSNLFVRSGANLAQRLGREIDRIVYISHGGYLDDTLLYMIIEFKTEFASLDDPGNETQAMATTPGDDLQAGTEDELAEYDD